MELLGFIIFVILVTSSVAAWINTKIILGEIDKIKKHLGIPEDRPFNILTSTDDSSDEDNEKKK